jgi:mannose-6-phosphate isomerase-like protein (cupin superfamily)
MRQPPLNIFKVDKPEGRLDVGQALGSNALKMFVYDLESGTSSSPYHYEYEEEWLLVIDGTLVLRAPDGERTLERGDLVRFPAGPEGAHKVMNRSSRAGAGSGCRPTRRVAPAAAAAPHDVSRTSSDAERAHDASAGASPAGRGTSAETRAAALCSTPPAAPDPTLADAGAQPAAAAPAAHGEG